MKQFSRRNSKQQVATSNQDPQIDGADVAGNKTRPQLEQPAADADPYSFDIEDDTDNAPRGPPAASDKGQATAQAKPGTKRSCDAISATAAAAARLVSKPVTRPAPTDRRPSPPKQPRSAAAQHVANAAAAAHKSELQTNSTAPPKQQPPQPVSVSAAAPVDAAPAPAANTVSGGRAEQGAASGGSKARPTAGNNPSKSVPAQGKAASGGASRKLPAAGSKRGRGASSATASRQQQSGSSQPPESAPGVVSSPAGPAGNSAGALSLPTPHRRSKLSAGLVAAASAAGGVEVRAAQTVMEAQERGELVKLQDDASYAMDGLAPTCKLDTQQDSAVSLTEMLSTRKGRVALRQDGLAQQFLTSLAKLKASKDCVLGLAATLSLWYLAAEDANPCYLASVAAAVLVDQLLQHDYPFEEVAAKGAAGAKLRRLLGLRPLSNLLASTGVVSSRGLLLITLEQATNSQHASKAAAIDKLKHNLRQHGALQRLAALVADTAAAPGGPAAASKQLHLLLLVLENATFTCPDNGCALAELSISSKGGSSKPARQQKQGQAGAGEGQVQPFPAVLVGVAQQLLQDIRQEQSHAALHALLSVMMNLIHDNKQGGALLCAVGGMDVAAHVYSSLLQPAAGSQEALCAAVLQHLELVSVALGVLMNLVSNEPQHSRRLAAAAGWAEGEADAAAAGAAAAAAGAPGSSGEASSFVRLLCTVMTALGQLLQHHMEAEDAGGPAQAGAAAAGGAAASGGSRGEGLPAGAKVVTSPSAAADALGSNSASEASIVEVYSGILLGFLVRDGGAGLAASVASLLPGGSLDPLLSATGRCLDFYLRTGAITDHTRVTLEQLLRQLRELKGGAGGQEGQQQRAGAGPQQQQTEPECIEVE